jgi:hypothetical protein
VWRLRVVAMAVSATATNAALLSIAGYRVVSQYEMARGGV